MLSTVYKSATPTGGEKSKPCIATGDSVLSWGSSLRNSSRIHVIESDVNELHEAR